MLLPFPRLAELMPRGLDTLGVVELVVELVVVAVPEVVVVVELGSGGPHGFGRGSRFSVLEGCTPEFSPFPPNAEKGLFPNYSNDDAILHLLLILKLELI